MMILLVYLIGCVLAYGLALGGLNQVAPELNNPYLSFWTFKGLWIYEPEGFDERWDKILENRRIDLRFSAFTSLLSWVSVLAVVTASCVFSHKIAFKLKLSAMPDKEEFRKYVKENA